MIYSWWSTEIIDEARDDNAHDPDEEIEVDEPRFKSHLNRNHVRFQQGENDNEENAGEHVRNQFCHAIKIVQIKNISCKKSENSTSSWGTTWRRTQLFPVLHSSFRTKWGIQLFLVSQYETSLDPSGFQPSGWRRSKASGWRKNKTKL